MKKNIHVLHISAIKTWGGGENQLVNLCQELEPHPEVSNRILCMGGSMLHKRLEKTSIPFKTAPLAFKMDPRYFLKIGKICREENIDLIHIHDSTALSLTVAGDLFHNLPPMLLSKKTSFPIRNRRQSRYKYNYPKIKAILCVSRRTKEITAENIDDPEKLKLIYHGTRFDSAAPLNALNLRKQFGIKPEVKIIGNIANHTRIKNLESFLEVADILVNQENRKDFFFVQIGGFSRITPSLQALLKEKNLLDHVKFLGFIPEASGLLPQFDISLLTSENEGIPQFIYESFFHEVPVVSTGVGGIPEIIEHGVNGLLAFKNDHGQLARHILSLSDNTELQQEFTSRSKKRVLESFSIPQMARQTLEEYKKIVYGKL